MAIPFVIACASGAIHANGSQICLLRGERDRGATSRAAAPFVWLGPGGFTTIGINGLITTQYWRSSEDLISYPYDEDRVHRGAWLTLYRPAHRASKAGVGLWHETCVVPAGQHETIYGNMKPIGLGKLVGSVPLGEKNRTATDRLVDPAQESAAPAAG